MAERTPRTIAEYQRWCASLQADVARKADYADQLAAQREHWLSAYRQAMATVAAREHELAAAAARIHELERQLSPRQRLRLVRPDGIA